MVYFSILLIFTDKETSFGEYNSFVINADSN